MKTRSKTRKERVKYDEMSIVNTKPSKELKQFNICLLYTSDAADE